MSAERFRTPDSKESESVVYRTTKGGIQRLLQAFEKPKHYRFPIFGGYTGERIGIVAEEEEQYAITWKSSRAQFFELPISGTARMWSTKTATNVLIFSKKEQCFALRDHLVDKFNVKAFKVYRDLFPSNFDPSANCSYYLQTYEENIAKSLVGKRTNIFVSPLLLGNNNRKILPLESYNSAFTFLYEIYSYTETHSLEWFFFSGFGIPIYKEKEDGINIIDDNNENQLIEVNLVNRLISVFEILFCTFLLSFQKLCIDVAAWILRPVVNYVIGIGIDDNEDFNIIDRRLIESWESFPLTYTATNQRSTKMVRFLLSFIETLRLVKRFLEKAVLALLLPILKVNFSSEKTLESYLLRKAFKGPNRALEIFLEKQLPYLSYGIKFSWEPVEKFEPLFWELIYPLDGLPSERIGPNRIAVGVARRCTQALLHKVDRFGNVYGVSMSDPYTLDVYDEPLVL